jgi:hypothetical protein
MTGNTGSHKCLSERLTGEHPTVYQHEWMGAIITSTANLKQQLALKATKFWSVESFCTKLIIILYIIYKRTSRFMERHELLEDAQEYEAQMQS